MESKKLKYYWDLLIYSPAIMFILFFIFYYKQPAVCSTIFIQYQRISLLNKLYSLYYIMYLVGAVILFYFGTVSAKTKYEKRLFYLGMLGMFIFTVPTHIFLVFLPAFKIKFGSVLCEFALLLAIEFIFVLWYKEKHKIKY